MTGLTPLAEPSKSAMGMGWARTQLPADFGALGSNSAFIKDLPTACRGSQEVAIYHQGSTAGYTSLVYLLPNTESAIIVLTNSISLNDCADWVGQTILEAFLGIKEPNNYAKYAQESADVHLAKFPAVRASLEAKRIPNTKPRKLDLYVGRFYNQIQDFFIEITVNDQDDSKSLRLAFQGLESQAWPMEHYQHDSFPWLMTRNEAASRARFTINPETLYRFDFNIDKHGKVDSLSWAHDADSPPETFQKIDNATIDSQNYQAM